MHTFVHLLTLSALVLHASSQSHSQTTAANAASDAQAGIAQLDLPSNTAAGGGSAQQYCQANPNSSGTTAFVGYAGSLDLQQDNFALFCTGAAIHPSAFGMFIYGVNQTEVPFGNGFLCINPFSRMPAQHLTSMTVVMLPQSAPEEFAGFTPGSSWNFQFWYRDAAGGGAHFNTSRALHVNFAP